MSTEIRRLLEIADCYPDFRGEIVTRPDHLFKDTECEECPNAGAVHVEYTVDDPEEGYVGTDAMFCTEHASAGVRCILDRADRSLDHDTTVSVNHWAIRYAFQARVA